MKTEARHGLARRKEVETLLETEIEVALQPIKSEELRQLDVSLPPSLFIGAWFLFEEGAEE